MYLDWPDDGACAHAHGPVIDIATMQRIAASPWHQRTGTAPARYVRHHTGDPMPRLQLTEPEYRALDLWSWSTAKHVLTCPAEALDQRQRPIDTTDSMRLGTMLHCAILEPAEYHQRYVVPPAVERQPGWEVEGGRGAYTLAALPGQTYATKAEARAALGASLAGEWVTAELLADVWARAEAARELLGPGVQTEVMLTGVIEGAACKGMADILGGGVVIDVKTMADVSPRAVQRAAHDGCWAGQLWTYGELGRQAGMGTPERYGILVVQAPRVSGSPLGLSSSRQPRPHCRLVWMDEAMVAAGRADALRVWRTVRQCEASGVWPDYEAEALTLPRWVREADGEEGW